MNRRNHLLRGVREHLVSQLVFFDEQYIHFADQYLSGLSRSEKKAVEHIIQKYAEHVTGMLQTDDSSLEGQLQSVVLVGSSAEVHYDDDTTERFTVVYPTEIDPDTNFVSFLSPIGRQLLFATRDSRLSLEIPDGHLSVRVKHVQFGFIGGFIP